MHLYYRLDENHNPIPCDFWELIAFNSDPENKIVKRDEFKFDNIYVSTVFLGLNHAWRDGPPILFETMIFGGPHDRYQERYCTWDEAVAGHQRAIEMIFELTHN